MGHTMNSASTRHPRPEVLDDVAQESGFWRFVGTVAIPTVGVALLVFAIGYLPRVALHHDPALFIQPSAGGSPVFDIPYERLQTVRHDSHSLGPTVTNAVPTEKSPVEPFPFERPLAVPGEFPLPVTVDGDEPPGRIEPAPLVADRAESIPTKLEPSTPDAGPSEPPRDLATIPRSVPSTPEPRMPEPPPLEPSVEAQLAELPASPESTLEAPVRSQLGPQQPVSPRPGPRVEVELEPPPAKAAPEPPALLQAIPAPRSGPPAAENPQVAMVRPGPAALLEKLLPHGRGRGHKLLAQLAATASTESCESRQLPFFRVIESNVLPARLVPGDRFSHRLVYALCTAGPDSLLTATVTRELRGSADVVLVDRTDGFRLRPGTWASDEDLAVPPNANPGLYSVNTTVTFGGRVWTEQTDLLIE
jgi:hypothetical protein